MRLVLTLTIICQEGAEYHRDRPTIKGRIEQTTLPHARILKTCARDTVLSPVRFQM